MRTSILRTRCECQASLSAQVNEGRQVVAAWASDRYGGERPSTAHSIGADRARFDVSWHCPFCGRFALRSFAEGALAYRDPTPDARP